MRLCWRSLRTLNSALYYFYHHFRRFHSDLEVGSRQHWWSAVVEKLTVDLECLYHRNDDHLLRSLDVMLQIICLRSVVVTDPGLAGYADVVEGFVRLLDVVDLDAAPGFVALLFGLPIWLGFGSDTAVERYLIRKGIHYHDGARPSVEFMRSPHRRNHIRNDAKIHKEARLTIDLETQLVEARRLFARNLLPLYQSVLAAKMVVPILHSAHQMPNSDHCLDDTVDLSHTKVACHVPWTIAYLISRYSAAFQSPAADFGFGVLVGFETAHIA